MAIYQHKKILIDEAILLSCILRYKIVIFRKITTTKQSFKNCNGAKNWFYFSDVCHMIIKNVHKNSFFMNVNASIIEIKYYFLCKEQKFP